MDTTLSNREHSEVFLRAALDAGKEVAVVYTCRPILDCLNGVLDRSITEGRTGSISTLIKTTREPPGRWPFYTTNTPIIRILGSGSWTTAALRANRRTLR